MPVDPGTASIIGGGIASGGGFLSSLVNIRENRKQREWAEGMSNTAHQREVRDLRAAGLNPILSATGGHGAAVPASPPAQIDNPLRELGAGVSSAARMNIDRDLLQAQIGNVRADTLVKAKTLEQIDSTMRLNYLNGILTSANARMLGAKTPWQELLGRGAELLRGSVDKLIGDSPNLGEAFQRLLSSDTKTLFRVLGFGDGAGNDYGGQSSARKIPVPNHQGQPVYTPGDPSRKQSVHRR